ncbi:hypothetical protein [uncultured Ruegeria sp.]|uniref:hypothetical protein n=1 Tax=uncultured Ruegeria sp. TaxID=259304 RepID=UPI0026077350|nr:hypothetical protein [uncultured Ruegeria sp.]
MAETDETTSCRSSLVRSLCVSLKLRLARHEAWVLKAARKVPFLSLFVFGTLWVWFFLPMIPIGILVIILLEHAVVFGAVIASVVGITGLAVIAPWFFRWYLICVGLMFGRCGLALSKENEVSSRLERLQGKLP